MAPKILIVEDDMMMRSILELYSEQSGFECVASVQSAEDALKILETKSTNIILLDIHLKTPMTGIELAKIIEKKYNLPIIYITAYIDKNLIINNISENIFGFLFKPIHKNNFKSTVYFALEKFQFNNQKKRENA